MLSSLPWLKPHQWPYWLRDYVNSGKTHPILPQYLSNSSTQTLCNYRNSFGGCWARCSDEIASVCHTSLIRQLLKTWQNVWRLPKLKFNVLWAQAQALFSTTNKIFSNSADTKKQLVFGNVLYICFFEKTSSSVGSCKATPAKMAKFFLQVQLRFTMSHPSRFRFSYKWIPSWDAIKKLARPYKSKTYSY